MPYRARVLHGKVGHASEETAFLSPVTGSPPYAPDIHKVHLVNNFPMPLMFHAARVVGTGT